MPQRPRTAPAVRRGAARRASQAASPSLASDRARRRERVNDRGKRNAPQSPGLVLVADLLQNGAKRREQLASIDASREKLPVIKTCINVAGKPLPLGSLVSG